MSFNPLLLPLLCMVLLTFTVWLYLFIRRIHEIGRKNISHQDLRDRAEAHALLGDSAPASNNLKNLFEMPVLFYLACMLSMLLLIQDSLLLGLAWAFVILRVVHSFVHCSYNDVLHRFTAYFLSCVFLLLMWIRLATYILMN